MPPLSYMALLQWAGKVTIETRENYIKSTYRNRCSIIGSNGPIDLSIPLIGGRDHHQLYSDSQICYTIDWQHRHYMSILSCYGSTPFFEHYMVYLRPFFDKRHVSLFEYNRELLKLLIRLMKLDVDVHFTEVYEKETVGQTDLRYVFKPSYELKEVNIETNKYLLKYVPYMTVFRRENISLNISCLDLLFNEGPQSKVILKQMMIQA
jgi:hypothetical protein